jgi:uncharacterized protein YbjT (DUF2867 family)
MKLIVFGASGMVGAGVLREALRDPSIDVVLSVGRRLCGVRDDKLRELIVDDLFDTTALEPELVGYDACIWAIGVSSVGLDEAAYAKVTEELTLLWARTLLRLNPVLSFCYCSAAGAGGRSMWFRVRQRVENALQQMPFAHVGAVRPGGIRPGPGIRSRTPAYQTALSILRPIFPLLTFFVRVFPSLLRTSEILGTAMLKVVKGQADRFLLESADINRLGSASS